MYKVLVVEDEIIIRKGIVYGFDYEKFNCVVVGEAGNGAVGIEMIHHLKPDIVITDINMPIKNAFDMLEETRDLIYSSIIISGVNEFELARKAINYGVSDFLIKPLDMDKFERALNKAIERLEIKKYYQKSSVTISGLNMTNPLQSFKYVDEDRLVVKMIDYVNDNYSQKITLDILEEELNYSKSVMQSRFKKATEVTFNEYVNRYRIQQSIELLKKTDLKIYEIAERCGFSEYKYFNKVFRKFTGVSTTVFLENLKR